MIDTNVARADTRAKIVDAAAGLLREHGPSAVTTRGVAEAAGVQAPTIYRLFGDKDGLLEAVAEQVMHTFVVAKTAVVEAASADDVDPLDDLRSGWLAQIEFGLANPTLFRLLSDPERVRTSPAAASGRLVLEARVHRLARSGRLRVSEDLAVGIIQAAGIGAIQTLLATPVERRDAGLADAMYEAVLAGILADAPDAAHTHDASDDGLLPLVVSLRARAAHLDPLTDAERQLLAQWLDRVIAAGA